jgi:hypothetical protein
MYFLEFAVNANTSDILDFLERENKFISPQIYPARNSEELSIFVNFHNQRQENAFSICTIIYTTRYGKSFPKCYEDTPDGQGNEVIRFEVSRLTDSRSLIKSSHAESDTSIELMYLIRLKRLLMAFNSKFPEDLQIRLETLQQEEGQQGWQESNNTILGNKVRLYGKLPKQPRIEPSSQSSARENSTNSISTDKNMNESTAVIGDANVITSNYYISGKKRSSKKKKK